jgi:DNA topoisomerase III
MKSLIIAEKPSVANDIAKSLGGFKKNSEGVWERDDALISNAFGHLVKIQAPAAIANRTPVIPEEFELVAIDKSASQLALLVRIIRRDDVGTIINACDAGREGELIFRRIVGYARTSKTIKRMWLQSMTPQAIKDSFAKMRTDAQMQPLTAAAFARSEADWIVGINGSRLCDTPVGRVQTPTLMIVVMREEAIRAFVPRKYFEVHTTIVLAAGSYVAKWTRDSANASAGDPPERIWDQPDAKAILARCQNRNPDRISEKKEASRSAAPALFDLTTLQREANRLFGFSAQETLDIAQALYQKHKVTTYPRTDAKALPEDYIPTVTRTIQSMATFGYEAFANAVLDNGWIKPTKRVFDNSKISDHFAIIPTGTAPRDLTAAEKKIFDLIARRLLAVFHPDAEYAVTIRTATIGADNFVARGRVLVNPGWLAVYQGEEPVKDGAGEAQTKLPLYQPGEIASTGGMKVVTSETKAPPRFTEATLLSAMEFAGRDIEDAALRDAISKKGLGTPATRAATIEGLISDSYLVREKKTLLPTERAFELKALLTRMGATALLSAELTGEWECELKAVEDGQAHPRTFMEHIKSFTLGWADRAAQFKPVRSADGGADVSCPSCGKSMRRIKGKTGYFWGCSGYQDGCRTTLPDNDGKPGEMGVGASSPAPQTSVACEKCGKPMRLVVNGPTGAFWGCTGYREGCRFTLPDIDGQPGKRERSAAPIAAPATRSAAATESMPVAAPSTKEPPKSAPKVCHSVGDVCPKCGSGKLTQRIESSSQKPFLGCTGYPACRFFSWLPAPAGAGQ